MYEVRPNSQTHTDLIRVHNSSSSLSSSATSTSMDPLISGTQKRRYVIDPTLIDARHAHNQEELLAEIGYKQELKRVFGTLEVFGIAWSIMGLLPSLSTTMSIALTDGPAAMVWSWLIASAAIFTMGLSMSEVASAIPTSGGLYYYTHYFAPKSLKSPLSFVIGTSNCLALASGYSSITYGFAEQVLSAVYIYYDGEFQITNPRLYGVFTAGILLGFFVTCFASSAVSRLQTTSVIANSALIVLFFIALPIGTAKNSKFNDASFIFTKTQNSTDWPDGWAFLLSMMCCIWTVSGFDSTIHMSEEAKDPSRAVPIGILGSISVCWVLGFAILVVIAACMDPDVASIINTPSGQPLVQIFYDSLGKKWAIAFISLTAVCQFFMAASALTACSRMIWSFARDDGLVFSSYVKVVDKKLKVPLRAVGAGACLALFMGLLILAGSVAASALFSIGIVSNYLCWSTPQVLRLFFGNESYKPGIFDLGKVFSPIVIIISVLCQYFIIILAFFPKNRQIASADEMNYSVVINCGTWILSFVYYYLFKRNVYIGPKSNLTEEEFEAVEVEVHTEPVVDKK